MDVWTPGREWAADDVMWSTREQFSGGVSLRWFCGGDGGWGVW